ncbi:Heat shock protein [Phytophthora fragariae]|uniref:Heat shock protein n=1 Tax=Phytophthora fragariae TaxID=53985 RepID=A0A6G0S2R0_9STRA|nr:Heat shock protein [Phytophthora fragariae]
MTGIVVGIDLGTTCSRVGVSRDERVEIIPNREGYFSTPSYVAFTDTACLIGEAAKCQMIRNARNTIFGMHQLIGRKFSDPEVQENIKYWPFEVARGPEDSPQVVVQYKGETKTFEPVEIIAMLLYKMRETAETYLGKEVKYAVITVSGCFNYFQRQAMKEAGAIAGINVARFINAATAACFAYDFDTLVPRRDELNVLVLDLGGGTSELSLTIVETNTIFEMITAIGDACVSSKDFDNRLVAHFVAEFQRIHGKDLRTNSRAMMRLRTSCEHAKRALSSSLEAYIYLDALYDGIDFCSTITRARLEFLCADLFDKILKLVEKVMKDAKVPKDQHEIVLVGGSTHILKVQQLVKIFFNGKTLSKPIRPDETATFGAAMLGGILGGQSSPKLEELLLLDAVSLGFGVEIDNATMEVMIPRNICLPTRKSRTFLTSFNSRSVMCIKVFEGEDTKMSGNCLLGELEIDVIAPMLSEIEVAIDVDANGCVSVSAEEKLTGKKKTLKIDISILSTAEIGRMRKKIEKIYHLDPEEELRIQSKVALEQEAILLCSSAAKRIVDLKRSIEEAQTIETDAMETLHWLDTNPSAKTEHLDAKRQKLGEASHAQIFWH